jgi:predicted  nucleic acid-binding Zn-ribbon protein
MSSDFRFYEQREQELATALREARSDLQRARDRVQHLEDTVRDLRDSHEIAAEQFQHICGLRDHQFQRLWMLHSLWQQCQHCKKITHLQLAD